MSKNCFWQSVTFFRWNIQKYQSMWKLVVEKQKKDVFFSILLLSLTSASMQWKAWNKTPQKPWCLITKFTSDRERAAPPSAHCWSPQRRSELCWTPPLPDEVSLKQIINNTHLAPALFTILSVNPESKATFVILASSFFLALCSASRWCRAES